MTDERRERKRKIRENKFWKEIERKGDVRWWR